MQMISERGAGAAPKGRRRRRNRELEFFVAGAAAATAMFDRNMVCLAASERWLKVFGLTMSPVGRRHYDVFPEIPAAWKAAENRCLAGATERLEAVAFPHTDGSLQWVRWEARPWRDEKGMIGGIVIATEDLTARKEAEASADHLASIVASSRDAIISTDFESTVTSWNAGASRLFGYDAEEMVGKSVALIIPPDRVAEERGGFERLLSVESVAHRETTRVAEDGRVLDVELTLLPIRNSFGTVSGVCHVMRDIGARGRAEEALRVSEEHLRLALSGARAGTWQWNIVTGETIWSPETYALHGLDPATPVPPDGAWLACVHPEGREGASRAVRDAIEKRTREYRSEYRVALSSGETRWVKGLGKVEFSDDGAPLRMSGINLDITDRKRGNWRCARAKPRCVKASSGCASPPTPGG